MNIQDIMQKINFHNVARANNWEVIIYLPQSLTNNVNFNRIVSNGKTNVLERIAISCETIDFPPKTLMSVERRTGQIINKLPYLNAKDDITASFRCSEDMFERKFFEEWQNTIQNPVSKEFGYLDDYGTQIDIIQYAQRVERNGEREKVFVMRLYAAYPLLISGINADQSVTDTYHRQSVTFTYQDYDVLGINKNTNEIETSRSLVQSLFDTTSDSLKNIVKNTFSL